jgi:hypothetical protein
MAVGGVFQCVVAGGLSFAFGFQGTFAYLVFLMLSTIFMSGYFVVRGHALGCAARRATLNILNLGTFWF